MITMVQIDDPTGNGTDLFKVWRGNAWVGYISVFDDGVVQAWSGDGSNVREFESVDAAKDRIAAGTLL